MFSQDYDPCSQNGGRWARWHQPRGRVCDPQLMSWTVRTSNQCSKEPRKPVEIFFFF